jgi:hypothetical protein
MKPAMSVPPTMRTTISVVRRDAMKPPVLACDERGEPDRAES